MRTRWVAVAGLLVGLGLSGWGGGMALNTSPTTTLAQTGSVEFLGETLHNLVTAIMAWCND